MNSRNVFAVSVVFVTSALTTLGTPQPAAGDDNAPNLPPIVFVSRAFLPTPVAEERTSPIERASDGQLVLLQTDGRETRVAANVPGSPPWTPTDVSDPSVSYDATRVVFSGYSPTETAWRIYEVRADGSGLRQITRSDRQLDLTSYGEAASA